MIPENFFFAQEEKPNVACGERERERETVELVVDAAAATPRTYKLASTHYALSINVYPNIDMYNI